MTRPLWIGLAALALAAALAALLRRPTPLVVAGEAAAIVGIFVLPLAYRLYRRSPDVATATRRASTATLIVAGVGLVVIAGGGAWSAITGTIAHVLLLGAIWPTPQRIDNFQPEEEAE